MRTVSDTETAVRAARLRRLMNASLESQTPQERDRKMQLHLAQARGPKGNALALRRLMDFAIRTGRFRRGISLTVQNEPFVDLIQTVVEVLDRVGVPYAITGSIASGIYGEPITFQNVDIVVRITPAQARRLAQELPQRFYRSAERLQSVAAEGGMANLIDADTGLKVDLSVLPKSPFDDSVMQRRASTSFGKGAPSFVTVTAEDVILMKLLWRKDTGSTKQWENALSVARVQGARLDWKYLFEQARALDIEHDLIKLRDEAGI